MHRFSRPMVQAHALHAFRIPADSMQPSLVPGDHVLVDEGALGGRTPQRGELVAYTDPDHPAYDFIRRLIALPGEGFEVKDNRPWINDWQVPYCVVAKDALVVGSEFEGDARKGRGEIDLEYLGEQSYLVFLNGEPRENAGPWVVQSDEFFVLNDNRSLGVRTHVCCLTVAVAAFHFRT